MASAPPMATKPFLSYADQVVLLRSRGMDVGDPEEAREILRRISYYRLSGYWYPLRRSLGDDSRADSFLPGTRLADVVAIYEFDERFRVSAFAGLVAIETTLRARLGHLMGAVDPYLHLLPSRLGPVARQASSSRPSDMYMHWRGRYEQEIEQSREDFVRHHKEKYGGRLPVWVARDLGLGESVVSLSDGSARDTENAGD